MSKKNVPAGLPDEEADHQALRDLRDAFIAAYNRGDVEAMLEMLDDRVSFTAMNGEVAHGKNGVHAYHVKMMEGPNARVKSTSIDSCEVDDKTVFYSGLFGVATGWADTSYNLADGTRFSARVRWSYSFTKHTGSWKIAAFHTSANIFDNGVLSMTKKAGVYAAAAAGAVGALAGGALAWLLRRR
jgi:uncharacterized protein (TIGR02246 family)